MFHRVGRLLLKVVEAVCARATTAPSAPPGA